MAEALAADVLVVGGGTAGAAAAAFCAARGLDVLMLERSPLDGAGARWVNGVPEWCFDEAGLARPVGPERLGDGAPAHLIAGHGPKRVVIGGHGVLEVDMRALVSRLHDLARRWGARLMGGVAVRGFEGERVRTSEGLVDARVVVDASGYRGCGLVPLSGLGPSDLCAAAQEVRELVDPHGARAFFEAAGVPLGEAAIFTGLHGGFSIINVRATGDHVSILTGSIPGEGHPSGRAILDRFVAEQPWIGPRRFGGSRVIPLARPRDQLVHGRVALLGDSGHQVFTAHGSGVGCGLVAAAELASALSDGRGLQGWATAWMRRWGGLLASYDVFRRWSQARTVDELERLMDAGLLDARTSTYGMAQKHVPLDPRLALLAGSGFARAPRLGASLLPVLARMAALRAHYSRYPARPERRATWAARATRLAGDASTSAAEATLQAP